MSNDTTDNYFNLKIPPHITSARMHFDAFSNGEVLFDKKKNHLPAMGWNSWNAFGSGNTEALTRIMADKFIELGLNKYGYEYIVLDDGCYNPVRVDGKIVNEKDKFPNGFKSLADYIHSKGLKFGMYNDIGTKLCAGLEVGTCGHEEEDAKSYVEWDIDFIKIDNCYYPWDNATFSDATNARFTYAPEIRSIKLKSIDISGTSVNESGQSIITRSAVWDGRIVGKGASIEGDYVTGIGTFDGTGPETSPVGCLSSELWFEVNVDESGKYQLQVEYRPGCEIGKGSWLQVAVQSGDSVTADSDGKIVFDTLLTDDIAQKQENESHIDAKGESDEIQNKNAEIEEFTFSPEIEIELKAGQNIIRLMNHRRQENTLLSYATFLDALNKAKPGHDIILSLCEWGKTNPQHWGYKIGDSWRVLNDITFQVGSDGDPGQAAWTSDYTTSVTAQYNKAVIMDEFAGLDKGWNDPDMLMIGMNGLTEEMNRSHMSLWCMLNAPLILGIDLRRVTKGDTYYKIITNEDLIALNQDALGIQAKRIYSSLESESPDKVYIRDNNRVDILAKPLGDGSLAVAFVNLSDHRWDEKISVSKDRIIRFIGQKMSNRDEFSEASTFSMKDLWTKEETVVDADNLKAEGLKPYECRVFKISYN